MGRIVNIDELPSDVQAQLPIALRVYSKTYDFDSLPPDIQAIVEPYVVTDTDSRTEKVLYDIKPEISQYNDLQTIDDIKTLLANYMRNYMLTPRRSYPFDPEFGSAMKRNVNLRDSNVARMLLQEDIMALLRDLTASTGVNISLQGIGLKYNAVKRAYDVSLSISIGSQTFNINVTTS